MSKPSFFPALELSSKKEKESSYRAKDGIAGASKLDPLEEGAAAASAGALVTAGLHRQAVAHSPHHAIP